MHLGFALVVAAGSGVFAKAGAQQAQPPSTKAKTATSNASGKSSHKSTKKTSSRRKEKGQIAPTPDRISTIQEALAKDGSFTSTPNGKWDDSTVEAMKKFQGAHGLNPSGKAGRADVGKAGFGLANGGHCGACCASEFVVETDESLSTIIPTVVFLA